MQNEGTFLVRPVGARAFAARSREKYGKLAEEYLALYPAGTEAEAAESQILSVRDQIAWMHLHWADLHTRNHRPAYLYLFTREVPLPAGPHFGFDERRLPDRLGAFHGACKLYAFDSLASQPWPWTAADHRLAGLMTSYWANFIAKGDPNGPGLPAWPRYGERPEPALELGLAVGPVALTLGRAKARFWEAYERSP
jgi:para-nitrobenzyl esterase